MPSISLEPTAPTASPAPSLDPTASPPSKKDDYWPGQEYCTFMWQYNEGRGYDEALVQDGDPTYTFGMGMEIQFETTSGNTAADLEEILNIALRNAPALHTAFCEWEAERAYQNALLELLARETDPNGRRNLEGTKNAVIQVLMEQWDDTEVDRCFGNGAREIRQGNGPCPWAMVTNVLQVWVEGDVDKEVLMERLAWALEYYMKNLIDSIDWVLQVSEGPLVEEREPGSGNGESGGGGDADGAETQELEQSSTKAGPYIGAAAGTLAFLLLLILLVRRNRSQDDMSHLKLEDDDDDTFVKEFASDTSPNPEYETRDIHVVGENDSVYSHWTGYTGRKPGIGGAQYNDAGGTTDVHHCSSATCEICEQRRQMGVNFVSTRSSLSKPPSLPSDASRDYLLEDTVEL